MEPTFRVSKKKSLPQSTVGLLHSACFDFRTGAHEEIFAMLEMKLAGIVDTREFFTQGIQCNREQEFVFRHVGHDEVLLVAAQNVTPKDAEVSKAKFFHPRMKLRFTDVRFE